MKISNLFLGATLAMGLAAGACDNSKADLDKTKADLATVTAERDGLKSQLDASKANEATLAKQVSDLNAKVAALPPTKDAATAKAPEHAMATPQKKDQKPSKKSSSKG
ncbi:MAG TPA: hypothetical protein VGP07_10380 [Polyangia bacterium]|jgi:cell division protein FtsB